MKHLVYLVITLIIVNLGCREESHSFEGQHPQHEKFEEYFEALTEVGDFNGVIYVSQNGEEIIHKAFNLKTDPNNSLYVTPQSQFDIHSVSKLMAHYMVLQLVSKGLIDMQDTLGKFIPGMNKGEEITIEMLLNHTSGLPRELSKYDGRLIDLEVPEMLELIKQEDLLFPPGKGAQYSNLGYQLLYYILGNATDGSFEEFLEKQLCTPLGMTNSGAHFFTTQKKLRSLAANHELEEDTIVQVDNILEDEFKQARIFSTADDLNLMLQAFQIDPLAHSMAKDSVIQHSGGSDGIRAHVYANLKSKSNFVLLCNFDGIPFEQTLIDMVNILEGKAYTIPKEINRKAITLDEQTVAHYEGTYVFSDMNNIELTFIVVNGQLTMHQDGEFQAELFAENDHTFFADPTEPESFEFIRNDRGSYDLLMGWRGVTLKGVKK